MQTLRLYFSPFKFFLVILIPDELCKLNLATSTYDDNIAYESLN